MGWASAGGSSKRLTSQLQEVTKTFNTHDSDPELHSLVPIKHNFQLSLILLQTAFIYILKYYLAQTYLKETFDYP